MELNRCSNAGSLFKMNQQPQPQQAAQAEAAAPAPAQQAQAPLSMDSVLFGSQNLRVGMPPAQTVPSSGMTERISSALLEFNAMSEAANEEINELNLSEGAQALLQHQVMNRLVANA